MEKPSVDVEKIEKSKLNYNRGEKNLSKWDLALNIAICVLSACGLGFFFLPMTCLVGMNKLSCLDLLMGLLNKRSEDSAEVFIMGNSVTKMFGILMVTAGVIIFIISIVTLIVSIYNLIRKKPNIGMAQSLTCANMIASLIGLVASIILVIKWNNDVMSFYRMAISWAGIVITVFMIASFVASLFVQKIQIFEEEKLNKTQNVKK